MALASDHLDLSARLGSRHRRRHTPLPRGAGRRRCGASRLDYVKQGIRRRIQDLATQALGYRSEREIIQSRGRVFEHLRFTDLDRISGSPRAGGPGGLLVFSFADMRAWGQAM
jgi:hypothetical protein